jgi:cytochrome c551/c552
MDNKIVGPGFAEIAKKVRRPRPMRRVPRRQDQGRRPGRLGAIPMPAQTLPAEDADDPQWLAQGKNG